jgi:hypothetical protein
VVAAGNYAFYEKSFKYNVLLSKIQQWQALGTALAGISLRHSDGRS